MPGRARTEISLNNNKKLKNTYWGKLENLKSIDDAKQQKQKRNETHSFTHSHD